ncbi:MAG: hypothetical protein F4Z31_01600 [Gemmatimonadetes bacterium]|nr:hypothetical protein [Gemmatimonadota bacterium]
MAALLAGCSFGRSDDNAEEASIPPDAATETDETAAPAGVPDPEATTTTTAPEPVMPAVSPGDYRWCPAWVPVEEAAIAYGREALRAQAAIEAIAGTITPSEDPAEWLSDPDTAVGALVEYTAASEAAAVAAEAAYRAVTSARDAAHMDRSRAYSALVRSRNRGDADSYSSALVVFRAADAAFQAALEASSDLDIMGELTIGTSGWQAGQFVDWPLEWPNPAAAPGFAGSVAAMCLQ